LSRARQYKTEAIVLKRRNLGEADKIITLHTPHLGKIQAVAKGIRRPTSKVGGCLELFTHSQLLLAVGRNLDIVTQCEVKDSFLPLRSSLWATTQAWYIAELTDKFLAERQENYPTFILLKKALGYLCVPVDAELVARWYELHLLGNLGFRPQFKECIHCNTGLKRNEENYFSASLGGLLCPRCADFLGLGIAVSGQGQELLRLLQQVNPKVAAVYSPSSEVRSEIENLNRSYIRHILERDLKAYKFIAEMKREYATSKGSS